MDDFLREIQTSLFREWINNQKRDYHTLLSVTISFLFFNNE